MIEKKQSSTFGIIIPTYNAGNCWRDCLESIEKQTINPFEVIVIDSSSQDSTKAIALEHGCNVICIDKEDFDHGKTRQFATSYLKNCDLIVFMTQDAILADTVSLEMLLRSFEDHKVAACYGRQLPRKQAGDFERYDRLYNYPELSLEKRFNHGDKCGVKTAFISNSFAAYRLKVLQEVGGFPSDIIMAEDMYVAAKMLLTGWSIYYCAGATVYHSHDYSLQELFGRYFDIGVFHSRESWIQEEFGKAGGEGRKYAKDEIIYLWQNKPLLIPYSILRNAVKFSGYRLGIFEQHLPRSIKRHLSMHKNYWD